MSHKNPGTFLFLEGAWYYVILWRHICLEQMKVTKPSTIIVLG